MKVSQETYEAVITAYSWYCGNPDCVNKADELHHRVSKSKVNQKMFPNFIHSPINLIPLCNDCHIQEKHKFKIPESVAYMYERWLSGLKENL